MGTGAYLLPHCWVRTEIPLLNRELVIREPLTPKDVLRQKPARDHIQSHHFLIPKTKGIITR